MAKRFPRDELVSRVLFAVWAVCWALMVGLPLLLSLLVLAVLVGHLVGITLAHDASLRTLPKEHAATGQLAMMVVMVLYTFGGLFLLFGA